MMNTVQMFHSSTMSNMLLLLILATNTAFSIRIGSISNATYIASTMGPTFFNMSCTECTCAALMASAVGWNCMTNNNTCGLIENYSSTDIGLVPTANGKFIFQQIPSKALPTTTEIAPTTIIQTTTTTSSTSAISTTHTITTTQNPLLCYFDDNSLRQNTWTQHTYTYFSAISTNLTLKFSFGANKKNGWYLDDVSVRNSSSVELLRNGNFESIPLIDRWTAGPLGSCGATAGNAPSGCHASTQYYYDMCDGVNIWISQSFTTTAGQVYNITFWSYYYYGGPSGGANLVQMTVTID